ncbi:MAG TPA: ATP-binding protein [Ignavibacteriaceae bacterium]|nr:ATP-binding protein [Ignavibacteriaceae bacterium]
MVVKNFRLNIILRVIVLGISITLLFYLILSTGLYASITVLILIIIYQLYSLIYFVEKTNRDLSRFLSAIEHSDFSQTFIDTSLGSSFRDLYQSFNNVILKFQNTRNEKEEHLRYLETVMQHVGIGLISYNQSGEIQFINNSAKRLLKITHLNNIASLSKISKTLTEKLFNLKAGDKETVRIVDDNDFIQLIIYATEFKLRDQRYILVSLQNIQSELEEREMEAWQQLIRVLTHEIMNSITPISSLAATVQSILKNSTMEENHPDQESLADIGDAVNTIQKRSEGLIHFVNSYRNLTRIPKPNFQIFQINSLFERINKLMGKELSEAGIKFNFSVNPRSLEITADPELIEQVIINLLINATQSLESKENGLISLTASPDERGKILIRVTDNGPGIPEEVLEKIFIPFYSTKKNGSGIGLSLSRQILRAHGGNIRVTSKPGEETIFTLRF